MEDCFEGVICFETLNPPIKPKDDDDNIDMASIDNDPIAHDEHAFLTESGSETNSVECNDEIPFKPTPRVLCKPSLEAMEAAIQIANIDPKKTVRHEMTISSMHFYFHCPLFEYMLSIFRFSSMTALET